MESAESPLSDAGKILPGSKSGARPCRARHRLKVLALGEREMQFEANEPVQ
jgi:hypothetical protein